MASLRLEEWALALLQDGPALPINASTGCCCRSWQVTWKEVRGLDWAALWDAGGELRLPALSGLGWPGLGGAGLRRPRGSG